MERLFLLTVLAFQGSGAIGVEHSTPFKKLRLPIKDHPSIRLKFSSDSRYASYVGPDESPFGKINFVDLHNFVHMGAFEGEVSSFSGDSRYVAMRERRKGIRIWDLEQGESVWIPGDPGDDVQVRFSSDNKRAVAFDRKEREARLYDLSGTQPKFIEEWSRVYEVQMSPHFVTILRSRYPCGGFGPSWVTVDLEDYSEKKYDLPSADKYDLSPSAPLAAFIGSTRNDHYVKLINARSRQVIWEKRSETEQYFNVEFWNDGSLLRIKTDYYGPQYFLRIQDFKLFEIRPCGGFRMVPLVSDTNGEHLFHCQKIEGGGRRFLVTSALTQNFGDVLADFPLSLFPSNLDTIESRFSSQSDFITLRFKTKKPKVKHFRYMLDVASGQVVWTQEGDISSDYGHVTDNGLYYIDRSKNRIKTFIKSNAPATAPPPIVVEHAEPYFYFWEPRVLSGTGYALLRATSYAFKSELWIVNQADGSLVERIPSKHTNYKISPNEKTVVYQPSDHHVEFLKLN